MIFYTGEAWFSLFDNMFPVATNLAILTGFVSGWLYNNEIL